MIAKGFYRHYKGNDYEVLGTVKHSETEELLVLYKSAKAEQLWVRPLNMFTEDVIVNGEKIKRFQFVEE